MKIPGTAIISEGKLTKYLLIRREFDDKSKFLNNAGFTLENYYILIEELLQLIQQEEAVRLEEPPGQGREAGACHKPRGRGFARDGNDPHAS